MFLCYLFITRLVESWLAKSGHPVVRPRRVVQPQRSYKRASWIFSASPSLVMDDSALQPRIVYDVQLLILDQLHEDLGALRVVSLVCKQWHTYCKPYLYRYIRAYFNEDDGPDYFRPFPFYTSQGSLDKLASSNEARLVKVLWLMSRDPKAHDFAARWDALFRHTRLRPVAMFIFNVSCNLTSESYRLTSVRFLRLVPRTMTVSKFHALLASLPQLEHLWLDFGLSYLEDDTFKAKPAVDLYRKIHLMVLYRQSCVLHSIDAFLVRHAEFFASCRISSSLVEWSQSTSGSLGTLIPKFNGIELSLWTEFLSDKNGGRYGLDIDELGAMFQMLNSFASLDYLHPTISVLDERHCDVEFVRITSAWLRNSKIKQKHLRLRIYKDVWTPVPVYTPALLDALHHSGSTTTSWELLNSPYDWDVAFLAWTAQQLDWRDMENRWYSGLGFNVRTEFERSLELDDW